MGKFAASSAVSVAIHTLPIPGDVESLQAALVERLQEILPRYLLSAGWVWQLYGVAMLYSVSEALERPESIDEHRALSDLPINGEVESACWRDSGHVVVSVSVCPEQVLGDPDRDDLGPMELGVSPDVDREGRCVA